MSAIKATQQTRVFLNGASHRLRDQSYFDPREEEVKTRCGLIYEPCTPLTVWLRGVPPRPACGNCERGHQ